MNSILRSPSIAILFSLMGLASAQAQISIGQGDMPVSNDTLRYSVASATATVLNLTATGPNTTWNFSTLVPLRQALAEYKLAAAVNPLYVFSFGLTGYGRKMADTAGAGPITVTDLYDFYKRESSKFSTVGRGFTFQGFPIASKYTDNDEVYQFPLNYSDRDSSTFRVKADLATIGSLVQVGYRINTVDGWGSITTPYGTFNALRVKTLVVQTDSLSSPQLPFPVTFTTNTITYTWLATGQRYPILQVTAQNDLGFETVTDITYRDVYRAIVPAAPVPDFFTFNRTLTVGDSVAIFNTTTPRAPGTSFTWSLSPATGWRFGVGSTAGSNNPLVVFTAPGSYSVTLAASNPGGSADTTKPDYIIVSALTGTAKPLAAIGGGISPNPTSGKAALTLPAGQWQARLLDASGRQALAWPKLEGGKTQLNLNALPAGLYILEVQEAGGKAGRFAERVSVAK